MAYFYLDDSKHHGFDFSIAAFVICDSDPTKDIRTAFNKYGFDPLFYEFKSSAKMKGNEKLQALRDSLKAYIGRRCKIAICIVNDDKRLGPASLKLLHNALLHPQLAGQEHQVFFDEGLFQSARAGAKLASNYPALSNCNIFFEQNSRSILGIQLADIVAHTCSIMLRETLGQVTKKIVVNEPRDNVYHGMEIELGFEMWAGVRYAFLSQNKQSPKEDFDPAIVDVYPWGLFIDESVKEEIATAAIERFGEIYLGCIH